MSRTKRRFTIITGGVAVSAVPTLKDLRIFKALCFASIINGAAPSAFTSHEYDENEIADAARAANMRYRAIGPALVVGKEVAYTQLRESIAALPGPVVLFAETVEEAAALWAGAMAGSTKAIEISDAFTRLAKRQAAFLANEQNPLPALVAS
ncbi:MAG: hypothetical protein R3C60_12415 [Parvularculaceae bacterium]